jgi:hypothetical protein
MIQADSVLSTPRTTAPESSLTMPEQALHEQLKAAGMRLERIDRDHYQIIWRSQNVASGLDAARCRSIHRPRFEPGGTVMTGNRELLPEDVLVDLLGSGDFPAQVLDPEAAAWIILRRLFDAGFEVVPITRDRP